jgi:hypothetical protein
MTFKLICETPWIKEWETPRGKIIDSKYRTFQIEPDAAAFIAAWRRADDAQRAEMEQALIYFPWDATEEFEKIVAGIAIDDTARATRIRAAWFTRDSELSAEMLEFTEAVARFVIEQNWPRKVICDTRWFSVLVNDGGFYVESKVENAFAMPTRQDLDRLYEQAPTVAHRRAVDMVRSAPWLIEPANPMVEINPLFDPNL